QGDHLAELPRAVHVQQRDRRTRRVEGLEQQVQQHRTVLAHRIQHHRIGEPGRCLAQDVDAFGLEAVEVGQRPWIFLQEYLPCNTRTARSRGWRTTLPYPPPTTKAIPSGRSR